MNLGAEMNQVQTKFPDINGAAATRPSIFRPDLEVVPLEWGALQRYLSSLGYSLDLSKAPPQFSGGFGNLNYLIQIDGAPYVLRRPPLGPIPIGANDMGREFHVLSRLWKCYSYAPRALLYCEDPSVIGAHFLIMEYRPGLTINSELPAGLTSEDVGPKLFKTIVNVLHQLHSVDPSCVGLENFGKPEGFLKRAVDGWHKRANLATGSTRLPIVAELVAWLEKNLVPGGSPTLLHCDFKLDNLILDPNDLRPVAVLDWDMATRGDPLFDLATLLSYWTEANDPPAMHELRQMPTALPGFPSRREVVAAYAYLSGRDISDFLFYRVLAMFKLGVVFLQLHARYLAGGTTNERYAQFGALGYGLLEFTHDIAQGKAF